MNRIDRLAAILIQLQSKRVVTAKEIASRFQISIRTVYRDIRALEEAGIPLGSEAGKGYYIVEGYHLPPVMFTKNEAESLLFAGKLVERFSDREIKNNFDSSLYKIKSILKNSEKDHLENLHSRIKVSPQPFGSNEKYPNILFKIQSLLEKRRVIDLEYYSSYNNKSTTRKVEPLGLYFYGSNWHLIAFCRLRDDYRDFRISRIYGINDLDEKFSVENHKSLDKIIKSFSKRTDLISTSVVFKKEVLKQVNEQKYFHGYISENEIGDDSVEMLFMVSSLSYFGNWLLLFKENVKIISPPELETYLKDFSKKLYSHYVVDSK